MTMGIMPITGIPLPFVSLRRLGHRRLPRPIGLVLNVHMRRFSSERPGPLPVHGSGPGPASESGVRVGSSRHVTLWPRLEPLLARVREAGPLHRLRGRRHQTPEHDPGKVAWLLVYPDTYEIGLPNQGLQILYEILNERADAVAERAYAPWTDLEAQLRAHGLPLFSVDTHRPARRVRPARLQPLGRARLHERPRTASTSPACPVRGGRARARATRWSSPAATAPTTPSRSPTSSTSSCSATARRSSARSPRWSRAWKAAGRTEGSPRATCCASSASVAGRLRARRCTTSPTTAPRLVAVDAPVSPTCPSGSRSAPSPTWPSGPTRSSQLVPLTEVVHDRLNVEVFRGCTRGCRFCQAGMITRPVRERPAEQVRTMVQRRPAPHRLRRGRPHVAVHRRLLAASSGVVADIVDDPANCGQVIGVAAAACGSTPSPSASPPRSSKARRTGLTFAPEAGTWRMRQVINKLIREEDLYGAVESAYSPGLAADEAVLPHRPAHRDRRGHARHRRAGPQLRRRSASSTPNGASVTVSVGGFVPKPHTPFQWFGQNTAAELQRKIGLLRDATRQGRGRAAQVARPPGHAGRGHRQPRRPPHRRRHRAGVARTAAPSRSGASTSTSTCGSTPWPPHGLDVDWYVHRHRTEDEVLPWDHLSAGLHKDFLWQDWRDALAEVGLADCRWTPCYDCGACTGYGIEHVVASAVPPAGGSQGTGQDLAAAARCRSRCSPAASRSRWRRAP